MDTIIQKAIKHRKVFSLFLAHPKRKFTPLEISKLSKVPYATVWRLVQSMRAQKIILVERIGAYNLCALNSKFPKIHAIKKLFSSINSLEATGTSKNNATEIPKTVK